MDEPSLESFSQMIQLFSGKACERRLGVLRHFLKKESLGAFVIRDPSNIAWLTARNLNIPKKESCAIYVDPEAAVLHVEPAYSDECWKALKGTPITLEVSSIPYTAFIKRRYGITLKNNPEAILGIEEVNTLRDYYELVNTLRNISPHRPIVTKNLIMHLRSVKDQGELYAMKAAQSITDAAFERTIARMRTGMTELDVKRLLDEAMFDFGAEGFAFSTCVSAGPNAAFRNALPGENRLEKGTCVVMDFGVRAFGYDSDMTRTVFVGAPPEVLVEVYEVVRRINEEVEAMLKPGITGREAQTLAESILAKENFAGLMGHELGHGVGIEIHELPNLSLDNDEPLVCGNVVTVEPGIYVPDAFGIRIEDCGVITADGFSPFPKTPHDMVII